MGLIANLRRLQRRRIRSDCGRPFGRRTGQRRWRLGPHSRSFHRDLRLKAHPRPHSRSSPPAPDPIAAPIPYQPVSATEAKQTTIGYLEDDGLTPVTPETRQAVRDAAEALQNQGFRVEPYRPQALEAARKLWWTLFVRCGAMLLEPQMLHRQDLMSPTFRNILDIAHTEPPLTGDELLSAWAATDTIRTAL